MCRRAFPWLVLALAAGCASRPAVTDPEARAVVEKAVQAQGGEEKLARFAAGWWKGHGTMVLNGQTVRLSVETVYQLPDKYKSVTEFDMQGKKIRGVQVLDGGEGWMSTQGATMRLDGALLKAFQEEFHAANVEMLVPLLRDGGYTLTKLGEATVAGKPAVGVKVASRGRKDVELYFDRDTLLPVRTVRFSLDPATLKEATVEVDYGDIKESDGVKWPGRMVVNQDGKKVMDVEVTEFKRLDKIDPAEFARPR